MPPKRKQPSGGHDPSQPPPQQGRWLSATNTSLTPQERAQWNGFCEIESEPAFFNVMLREFGVKGARVQEVLHVEVGDDIGLDVVCCCGRQCH
ncbi:Ubiquitin carboxyl-terminal hydrolase bap1 [Ascosphaera acerosa]|nr:Ubiquitin carboxyl-terminal hydrolase bap1 [Ascosphaera acerosa]